MKEIYSLITVEYAYRFMLGFDYSGLIPDKRFRLKAFRYFTIYFLCFEITFHFHKNVNHFIHFYTNL